ncbi:MAG: hypothetical protein Q7W05_00105, partial [Deltaproteobacteria bacterium]|nr:hypothetical protein [Deltaproteobacteria bacterium]
EKYFYRLVRPVCRYGSSIDRNFETAQSLDLQSGARYIHGTPRKLDIKIVQQKYDRACDLTVQVIRNLRAGKNLETTMNVTG